MQHSIARVVAQFGSGGRLGGGYPPPPLKYPKVRPNKDLGLDFGG